MNWHAASRTTPSPCSDREASHPPTVTYIRPVSDRPCCARSRKWSLRRIAKREPAIEPDHQDAATRLLVPPECARRSSALIARGVSTQTSVPPARRTAVARAPTCESWRVSMNTQSVASSARMASACCRNRRSDTCRQARGADAAGRADAAQTDTASAREQRLQLIARMAPCPMTDSPMPGPVSRRRH